MTDLNEIQATFDVLTDWEDRYAYLIDLGHKLPKFDDSDAIDDNLIRGCTSRVWMVLNTKNDILSIRADSDAHIVRGLIALVVAVYNGQNVNVLDTIDMNKIFKDLGLVEHISPNRRNGFFSMVNKISELNR
jgi:cysteine desulfuration protein SufE